MSDSPSLPPVRVVLVGCGGVSNAWLTHSTRSPDIQIVALVDLRLESAQVQAAKYGLEVPLFTDLVEALAAVKPEAVFDCSIPSTHSWVACTAMEAGCHAISEKPLSDSIESARRSVETARRTGKIYAIMQNRRSEAAARKVREIIESGAIGNVYALYCDFFKAVYFSCFRSTMPHVLLVDMSIHHFDIARYFSGKDALSVYCVENNPTHEWPGFGPNAHAIFQMQDNVVFNYTGSWCAEGLETPWNANWRIVGEKGTLFWDGDGRIVVESLSVDAEGKRSLERTEMDIPVNPWPGPHGFVIGNFIKAIRSGEAPETRAEDNIKSLAMVFGAVESAEKGTAVPVDIGKSV